MWQVRQNTIQQIERTALLPDGKPLDFDAADQRSMPSGCNDALLEQRGGVQKTLRRTVVSLQYGCVSVREIVRQYTENDTTVVHHSARLADMVASGSRYTFDLISHVGAEGYLRGRSLEDIHQDLAEHQPAIDIPMSSLWDQQQKFLFYFGHMHKQATPILRDYLAEQRPVIWLLDGTIEPGTSVFLGIQDAVSGILLACWKIPSEKEDDIARCLREAAARYGLPDRVLHDLSDAMSSACNQALAGVPHFVCHYHLASDVGEDLCEKPQGLLYKRMGALKVQFRLREQRRGQKRWFGQRIDTPAQLVLEELLTGRQVDGVFGESLGREVLLALHYWILDYRSDGQRRGFPFDPYTLYLHRRLVRAGEAADRLLSHSDVAGQAPQVIFNLQKLLAEYRTDTQIVAAADSYERSFSIFTRLREALRLTADDMHSLRQPHELPADQQQDLKTALHRLRNQLRQQEKDKGDADRKLVQIVLWHLDKYWSHLIPDEALAEEERWERTNNKLERHWGDAKRARRQTHGRRKLTRDFQSLPEEYMLVPNLDNSTYVQLVLGGSLDQLPAKLADASRQAGSFSAWQRRRRPRLVGQLPRRLIRADGFVDDLVDTCEDHCQASKAAA